jgi:hypothetical protein
VTIFFDRVDRVKSRRRIKFGEVSGPQAPSRGALPGGIDQIYMKAF